MPKKENGFYLKQLKKECAENAKNISLVFFWIESIFIILHTNYYKKRHFGSGSSFIISTSRLNMTLRAKMHSSNTISHSTMQIPGLLYRLFVWYVALLHFSFTCICILVLFLFLVLFLNTLRHIVCTDTHLADHAVYLKTYPCAPVLILLSR